MIHFIGKTNIFYVLIIVNIKVNDCSAQQPIVRPVLHLQDSDIYTRDDPFSYSPYETTFEP
jgi:hypothetical protein